MDQVSIWLSILWMMTMAAMMTPGILRLNRGKALRNAALWLGIVLTLALFYRAFGPFKNGMQGLPVGSHIEQNNGESASPAPPPGRPKLGDSEL
ncbi:MAG: hypothetical protein WDO70_04040 [Alphaproteobacteria bacterium]